jgi:prevent-host-death family protein
MSNDATLWSVTQAKARFSEVVDRAREQGPQAITKNGRPAVVVVSIEEWTRKTGTAQRHPRRLLRGFSVAPFRSRNRAPTRRNPRGRFVSRGWLIDTNVVSEWVKPRPDAGVASRAVSCRWMSGLPTPAAASWHERGRPAAGSERWMR